jgi:hypothetical protein
MRSPDSGLMMNMCAVAGLRSARSLRMRPAALAILRSAEDSHSGLPQISAPRRSAAYSRVRLIAICTSIAASGATIMATSTPMKPSGLLLLPPKKKAKLPSMAIAPASVAVIVMISVSRFCTWASSCAITPATSSRRQAAQQAGGGGHGRVLRIAAGGEGIGLGLVDDVDLRHGQFGARRQIAHHAIEFRRGALVDLARIVHAQHHLVGVPVAEQVHRGSDHQRDQHAAFAADQIADAHEERRHEGQQHRGADEVHGRLSVDLRGSQPRLDRLYMMGSAPCGFNMSCRQGGHGNDEHEPAPVQRMAAIARRLRRALAEAEAAPGSGAGRQRGAPEGDRRQRRSRSGPLRRLGGQGHRQRLLDESFREVVRSAGPLRSPVSTSPSCCRDGIGSGIRPALTS